MSNTNNTVSENNKYFAIYFTDFLKGFKKFWWICVVFALVLGGYRFVDGYRSYVPVYTSSATFTIITQSSQSTISGISSFSFYYDANTASQLTETFPHILQSNILQEAICNDMKVDYLPASLSASYVSGTNLFTLSATGKDPVKTYEVLLSAIDNYPDAAKYVVGNLKFEMIETPVIASSPSNRHNYVSNAAEGAAIGIIIGLFLVLLYAVLRKTIRLKEDVKRELNLEAIASIPRIVFKKYQSGKDRAVLFTNEKIESEFLESYRVLRNIFVNSTTEDEKVFIVTSTAPGEGKTTTTANLALSLSSINKKVLLVDSDVHHPSVIDALYLEADEYKLTDKMKSSYGSIVYKQFHCKGINLDLLTLEIEDTKKNVNIDFSDLQGIIDGYRSKYDYIIIDTPPCGLVSDAMYIAPAADAAIYVIHQDFVRISKIRAGINNLLSTDTRIFGCILNGAEISGTRYGYGYGYGYGHKYGSGKHKYGYGEKKHEKIQ